MKVKVYQCVTDELEFINGKIYDCVGYDKEHNMARIVDETNEDYLYLLDNFDLIEDYRKN